MIKQALLALVLLFSVNSCGGQLVLTECEMFVAGGLTICSLKPIAPADVETLVQITEQELIAYYPEAIGLAPMLQMHGVIVYALDAEGLGYGCHKTGFDDNLYTCDHMIGGRNMNGTEIIIKWHECLAYTSLAHEILHSVQVFVLDSSEEEMLNHSTPYLFSTWGLENGQTWNTVEGRVNSRLMNTLTTCW